MVHNLEHGGIAVSYNALPADDLARLKALPGTLPRDRFNAVKVVIHPYDKIPPGTFVLTAWGWRERFTAYDDAKVRAFIDAHIERCCESVPSVSFPGRFETDLACAPEGVRHDHSIQPAEPPAARRGVPRRAAGRAVGHSR